MAATWSLKAGSAYRRAGKTWEHVMLSASEVGGAVLIVVPVEVEGAPCALFRGRDSQGYAQPISVAADPESIGIGTEPQPPPTRSA
jgi:hypothetical protein